MRKAFWLLGVLVAVSMVSWPANAQGAVCTGTCWQSGGTPYCGFTAFQEGGRCVILTDQWGHPTTCIVFSCSGGGGWTPENQGLLPWLVEPATAVNAKAVQVEVTVIEPRT